MNELSYSLAKRIREWRCEDQLSFEEISKKLFNLIGDDNGFIPKREKEEKYTNYFSPI